MSDTKISALTDGGAGETTDEFVIARGGANYKLTGANLAGALGGSIAYNGVTFLQPDQGGWSIFDRVKFMPRPSGDTTGATDTATLQALLNELPSTGGEIWLSAGDYYFTQVTVPTKTRLRGLGKRTTSCHLAAGTNTDLFVSTSFSTLTGGGTTGGVTDVEICDMEIDGNKSGQTISATTVATTTALPAGTIPLASSAGFSAGGGVASILTTSGMQVVTYTGLSGNSLTGCTGGTGTATAGYKAYAVGRGVAIFGRSIAVRRCWIHDCVGDGLWTEWSLTGSANSTGSMEGSFEDNKYSANGASGHAFSGPHDSVHRGCISYANAYGGWVINATGNFTGCHGWGVPQVVSYHVATGACTFGNCIAEVTNTSGSVGVYLGGVSGTTWTGGAIFVPSASLSSGAVGVQVQGASDTFFETNWYGCEAGAVYLASDGGNNFFGGVAKSTLGPAVTHIVTSIASGSNGVDVSTFSGSQTLSVASSTSFYTTSTPYVIVPTSTGYAVLSYTATAAGQLQNVTLVSGSGTLATGGFVAQGRHINGQLNNDLGTLATSSVVRMVVAGGTNAKNIDTTRGYTHRNGTVTPSATINTYGSTTTIVPATAASRTNDYGAKLEALILTAANLGSETLTVQIFANTVDQTQTSITVTLSNTTPYALTATDIYNLVTLGTPINYQIQVKSSIGSSGASVAWSFLGWS